MQYTGANHSQTLSTGLLPQVHLSHNLIGGAGAAALLAQVPAPSRAAQPGKKASFGPGGPGRGLWLRLEWNQIPVDGLTAMLGEEKHRRGLLSDIPVKRAMASRGHEQTLRFAGAPPSPLHTDTLLRPASTA